MQATEKTLLSKLTEYLAIGEITDPLAQEIFRLHKKWLQFSWGSYQANAHKGVAMMYVADPRFTAYYDEKSGVGSAAALNAIIQYYA